MHSGKNDDNITVFQIFSNQFITKFAYIKHIMAIINMTIYNPKCFN